MQRNTRATHPGGRCARCADTGVILAVLVTLLASLPSLWAQNTDPAKRRRIADRIDASRRTALVQAVERVGPSVVSIGAERTLLVRRGMPLDQLFFPFADPGTFYERTRQKTPYLGSGIVVDRQGHVVTNYHVIDGASRIFVTPPDRKEYEAKLVDADPLRDIAILKIEAEGLDPAPLGDSDEILLGEWAIAIGNPYGAFLADPTPTITAGVVSATNRFFRSSGRSPRIYEGMIQTDAAINPGNSGGPLVNALGQVVGINTFIFSESGGSVGIGFAIPINRVKSMMNEIRQYGRLREARLDFEIADITRRIQYYLNLPSRQGVLVHRVEKGGSAERAGLRPGDVVLSVNNHDVNTRRDLLVHVLGEAIGTRLNIQILRNGQKLRILYVVQPDEK